MKIAFISTMASDPWGGSEQLWVGAAAELLKKGHQVHAGVWRWPTLAQPILHLEEAGCRLHPYSVAPFPVRALQRAGRFQNWGFRWLETTRPDFVIISDGGAYTIGPTAMRCQKLDIRYVIVAQAANEATWPSDALAASLRTAYASAQRCFFVSDRNRRLVETQIGIDLPDAEVVRNPFNVPYDEPFSWPDDADPTRIACVGRLAIHAKGQDVLLEVLGREKWRSRPVELSLVGNGEHGECLKRMVDRLALKHVHFKGFVQDIASIWNTHHALVLPSRFEGLPLAVVEASLCGRVCIVTDVAGNSELITDGQTGFLAAAPTADLLDEAMERAWTRRGAWREIGQQAYLRSRQVIPPNPIAVFAERLLSIAKR